MVMAGSVMVLQGCLAGSSPLGARIEVRDSQSGRPVPHAVVRWTGGNVFIPPRDVLGPPISPPATPAGGKAETNNSGAADIVLAGSRPNELTVTAEGYPPLHLTLEAAADSVRGAVYWTEGRRPPIGAGEATKPTLEVRVRADH
ncbi:MAG TPA: hypothetical protein DEO92_05030 [Phycisphaerales bacterium]|nr:hypothetical protein [Phycisphaerales bacterium]|tara:strand:+ start:110 stop:541 length:432 start_codon:yes stop_codon:yes gene_type:complete